MVGLTPQKGSDMVRSRLRAIYRTAEATKLATGRLERALDSELQTFKQHRLAETVEQLASSGLVLDAEDGLGVRPAKVWVVVGQAGVPDDVEIVNEHMGFSLEGGISSRPVRPNLAGYVEEGKVVLTKSEFLDLAACLFDQAKAGTLKLPYRPT